MDDYITKPIDFGRLAQLIAKHFSPEPTAGGEPAPPPTADNAVPAEAINVARLLERYAATPQLIPTLLDRFEQQITANRTALEAQLAQGQLESLATLAHTLKGSAAYLAAERISALAAQVEAGGRAKDLESIRAGVAELQREIDACLQQIPQVRERIIAPGKGA